MLKQNNELKQNNALLNKHPLKLSLRMVEIPKEPPEEIDPNLVKKETQILAEGGLFLPTW